MLTTVQPSPIADKTVVKAGMRHRLDIDGLRALAVIPVVLYHAHLLRMPGGFVGVDIFFVISGYLITGLILGALGKGRFSIVDFYERRARRILPALFAVLAVTSVAAYLVLLPHNLRDYGRSLIATLFFFSNILFSKQAGYFDAPSEMKPLLHTWSLAVEEQFYIVYPLFLFLVARYLRKRYLLAIGAAFVLSFALSIRQLHADPAGAFFLAPPRAWELMMGGLLALNVLPELRHILARNILGLCGLALIFYSIFAFSPETPFPGYNALFPCVGAALIIYSGATQKSWAARLLSTKPLVFVGLISYSLYLWHWVLLFFARYYLIRPLNRVQAAAFVAAAFFAATLSWRFVETPVRNRNFASRRWIFAGAGLVSLPLAAFGGFAFVKHGFPGRYSGEARRLVDGADDIWKRRDECLSKICRVGVEDVPASFALWGDSHAGAVAPGLEQFALANHLSGYVAYQGACAPLLHLKRYDQSFDCETFNQKVFDYLRAHRVATIFLEGRWALYAEGSRYKEEPGTPALLAEGGRPSQDYAVFEKLVPATLEQLQKLGSKVVIIASTPEVGIDVPTALARQLLSGISFSLAPSTSAFMDRQRRAFQVLSDAAPKYSTEIVYPHRLLCDQTNCAVIKDGRPLYSDDNHLSTHGATVLTPIFEKALLSSSSTHAR
ncbi:MAG: acyltransferase family protein [Acidobacteriaceae bacterium]|nr:acyltransferase family protein [Acidobacteriaceae bacterium]